MAMASQGANELQLLESEIQKASDSLMADIIQVRPGFLGVRNAGTRDVASQANFLQSGLFRLYCNNASAGGGGPQCAQAARPRQEALRQDALGALLDTARLPIWIITGCKGRFCCYDVTAESANDRWVFFYAHFCLHPRLTPISFPSFLSPSGSPQSLNEDEVDKVVITTLKEEAEGLEEAGIEFTMEGAELVAEAVDMRRVRATYTQILDYIK